MSCPIGSESTCLPGTIIGIVEGGSGSPGCCLSGAIAVRLEGAQRVLCLVGEIDVLMVEAFERIHGAQPVAVDVIDAGAVTLMTATGIHLMLRWKSESTAQGRAAVLRRSSRSVDRLLTLTGLHPIFDG